VSESFLPFLPKISQTGELTVESKRMLIMFLCFRLGTSHADDDMLDLTVKTARPGTSFDFDYIIT
jgi:hypothetical protein